MTPIERKGNRLKALMLLELGDKFKEDPVLWCRMKLPSVVMWDGLKTMLESCRDNNETLFQTANGLGKTYAFAILMLWWLDTRKPCKVLTTGSSWRALKEHLWPYAHTLIKANGLFLGAPPGSILDMEINLPGDRTAYAAATSTDTGLAGAHSEYLLQIVEEGNGIEESIAQQIQGNARGPNTRTVWGGNPLKPSGPFFDKAQSPLVETIQLSVFDHPNIQTGENLIPGAVIRADVERDAFDWCTPCAPDSPGSVHLWWKGIAGWYIPSPVFIARDMGIFPEIDLDALIDRIKIRAAIGRQIADPVPTAMGIDVARSTAGDETVIALANKTGVISITPMRVNDLVLIVGRVIDILKLYPSIRRIGVDAIGIGAGIVDMLRANNYEVIAVNVAEPAIIKSDYYLNLKAQIYWEFKEKIESGDTFSLPDDTLLRDQIEMLKPDFGMAGHHVKVKIEDKEKYKKRAGYSPDRAEACIIAMHVTKFETSIFIPGAYTSEAYEYEGEERQDRGGMFR